MSSTTTATEPVTQSQTDDDIPGVSCVTESFIVITGIDCKHCGHSEI